MYFQLNSRGWVEKWKEKKYSVWSCSLSSQAGNLSLKHPEQLQSQKFSLFVTWKLWNVPALCLGDWPVYPFLVRLCWKPRNLGRKKYGVTVWARFALSASELKLYAALESPRVSLKMKIPGLQPHLLWSCWSEVRSRSLFFTSNARDSTARVWQTTFWETSFYSIIPILQIPNLHLAQTVQMTWLNISWTWFL